MRTTDLCTNSCLKRLVLTWEVRAWGPWEEDKDHRRAAQSAPAVAARHPVRSIFEDHTAPPWPSNVACQSPVLEARRMARRSWLAQMKLVPSMGGGEKENVGREGKGVRGFDPIGEPQKEKGKIKRTKRK